MSVLSCTPVPVPKAVRDLLADLLDRGVEVSPAPPYAPAHDEPGSLAVYVDDKTIVRAVAVVDLAFSARAGAAIGLVPTHGAEEAIAEKALTDTLRENLYEVLNICAALLNAEGVPHVKLYQLYDPATLPPAEISACARTLGRRLDLNVTIAGYGTGRFSLIILG